MKRFITIFCLSISALIVLDALDVAGALARFLLAGELPWSHATVSAGGMFLIMSAAFTVFAVSLMPTDWIKKKPAAKASRPRTRRRTA